MNTETITKTIMNRNAAGEIEKSAMANCLMILNAHQNAVVTSVFGKADEEVVVGRMFECKTCNRKFSSFQALGGHRASHKKTKPPLSGEVSDDVKSPSKPKAHACKICGAEFPIGQALGGHMRRHRENLEGQDGNNAAKTGEVEIDEKKLSAMSSVTTEGSSGNSDGNDGGIAGNKRKINDDGVVSEVPVSNNLSSKRVCLDLSLWWNNEQLEEYAGATAENNNDDDVNKKINDDVKNDDNEIEEGEIVEEHEEEEEEKDSLKLELRLHHQ